MIVTGASGLPWCGLCCSPLQRLPAERPPESRSSLLVVAAGTAASGEMPGVPHAASSSASSSKAVETTALS